MNYQNIMTRRRSPPWAVRKDAAAASEAGAGFMVSSGAVGPLPPWEQRATEAIGNAIEAWGFKRNQGRLWALLYLGGEPLCSADIQRALGLSKGAVSMLTRELEAWGVVRRVRVSQKSTWSFVAETNLMRMVGRVLREREAGIVRRIRADLDAAWEEADGASPCPTGVRDRIDRLRKLAALGEQAIRFFVETARLDFTPAFEVLQGGKHDG